MFTYQIRRRLFRHKPGSELVFPADCVIAFHLEPPQPFGKAAGGGRTAVLDQPATVLFNANNGEHSVASKQPLSPLDVTIEEPGRTVKLDGQTLTISARFDSLNEVGETIESLYFVLPALLSVGFADPPYVERVDGTVGENRFSWELADWKMPFLIVSQDYQETKVITAWERIGILAEPKRRRLLAAIHYFHQACRLARANATVGEFLAEVVLNLAKSLEALFPPPAGMKSRDAIRQGLSSLGLSSAAIERDFMPAIALRNEIDVGHVELGLFQMEELQVVHSFSERAENAFRDMFEKLFSLIQSGEFEIVPYELGRARREALAVIVRLKKVQGNAPI